MRRQGGKSPWPRGGRRGIEYPWRWVAQPAGQQPVMWPPMVCTAAPARRRCFGEHGKSGRILCPPASAGQTICTLRLPAGTAARQPWPCLACRKKSASKARIWPLPCAKSPCFCGGCGSANVFKQAKQTRFPRAVLHAWKHHSAARSHRAGSQVARRAGVGRNAERLLGWRGVNWRLGWLVTWLPHQTGAWLGRSVSTYGAEAKSPSTETERPRGIRGPIIAKALKNWLETSPRNTDAAAQKLRRLYLQRKAFWGFFGNEYRRRGSKARPKAAKAGGVPCGPKK